MFSCFSFFCSVLLVVAAVAGGGTPSQTTAQYTVTFNSNGGSSVPTQTVNAGQTVTRPNNPVRNGYSFVSWNTDQQLTTQFDFSTPIHSNLTLYAKWQQNSTNISPTPTSPDEVPVLTQNYTVTFVSNGGSLVASQTVSSGSKATAPAVPTREGYTFEGWYRDSSLSNIFSFDTAITGNITLYAKWTAIAPATASSFTVTYDSMGGTHVASIQVDSGDTIITPPSAPSYEGSIFTGWYKDTDYKEAFAFGVSGDKILQNTTLYASWFENNPSAFKVDYAIAAVNIGYAEGNTPDYVSDDLTFPTSVDEVADAYISWTTSNLSVINSNGRVTRPEANTAVTITATATLGGETASRDFEVVVIKKRSMSIEEAKATIELSDISWLQALNESDDEFFISYNESSDQVKGIDGKFTTLSIDNADDALDALQSVHTILGVSDPYEELAINKVHSSEYGTQYSFLQNYDGLKVFGRNIVASANPEGESNFVSSSFLATEILDTAKASGDLTASYLQDYCETVAVQYANDNHTNGSFDVRPGNTQKVIFSLGNYQNTPVVAYIVNIYGYDEDGYLEEDIVVSAKSGEVIYVMERTFGITKRGQRENGGFAYFEVTLGDDGVLYLLDPANHVQLYVHDDGESDRVTYDENLTDGGVDGHQVSAYANLVDVVKWFKSEFDRNSFDGKGTLFKLITHQTKYQENGQPDLNNAAWWPGYEIFLAYDNSSSSILKYTVSTAHDVWAHEGGHAVMLFELGYDIYPALNGAVHEGMADVFACLYDTNNWTTLEDIVDHWDWFTHKQHDRNLANPGDSASITQGPAKLSEAGNYSDGHELGLLIGHSAYLMHQKGIDYHTLGQIWYNSINMGLQPSTTLEKDMYNVRECVLRAAKTIGRPQNEINIIKEAFNEVEITGQLNTVNFNVSEYNGETLSDFLLTAQFGTSRITYDNRLSRPERKSQLNLPAGVFNIEVSKTGYVPFKIRQRVDEGDELTIDVQLVKTGYGSLSGTVRDSEAGSYVTDATVTLRSGFNVRSGSAAVTPVTTTGGTYSFENIASGYYTLAVSKSGYSPLFYNVIIPPDTPQVFNVVFASSVSTGEYRVTLQWDENPSDLDSHLYAKLSDDHTFHVYYGNRNGYRNDGTLAANLDRDDTSGNGFETTTLTRENSAQYKYYVHWYSGSGTWGGSNAIVILYRGSSQIKRWTVPSSFASVEGSSSQAWHVFDLTSDGRVVEVNTHLSNFECHNHNFDFTESTASTSASNARTTYSAPAKVLPDKKEK